MERKRRNSIILLLVLAALLGAGALTWAVLPKDPGMVAVIQQEGRELMTLPLGKDRELVVQHPVSGYNAIQVTGGRIHVTDADCGDQTCVRTGFAWEEGQVIACLPHRLIIYIEKG